MIGPGISFALGVFGGDADRSPAIAVDPAYPQGQESPMSRILVVEDSATQAMQIRLLLEEAGFEVEVARGGADGLAALDRAGVDVVLSDLDMPGLNGLDLVEAIRINHPAVPVILMTALGSEEIAAQALQRGAASYVPKKNLDRDILPTLRNVLGVANAERAQDRISECLTRAEFRFRLESDPTLVPLLIGHLREHVARLQSCDETDLIRVGMALNEALLNAIYHGNLEVDSALRQEDERHFHDLAGRRRRQSPYRDRRVEVVATIGPAEARFVVRDEGPGFDPDSLPDPCDSANLDCIGGRGLLLIRTFMDEVSYNAIGNEITMIKRCRPR